MKQILFIVFALLSGVLNAQTPKVSSGRIDHIENFPSRLVEPRNIDIWLPDGYDVNKKYCVIYMHDGQMLFDSTQTWNKKEWRTAADHKIYMDYGTGESDKPYELTQSFVDLIAKGKGYTENNYLSKVYDKAVHDENAWSSRLNVPVEFLLNIH